MNQITVRQEAIFRITKTTPMDCGFNFKKTPVTELFGVKVFSDSVMQEKLPRNVYKSLKKTIEDGKPLEPSIADIVANAMKDWALENGATHFTHWFHPLTGLTAEKHDSFLSPSSNGKIIMEFSGKELIKGEPDASSFPSGGIRATFEARGYTAWDATSPAFLKDDTLCIPTAFCSYTGEALDMKTPLLRSMDILSEHALRVLRIFGNTTATRVIPTVGAEQEYFLIDKNFYNLRPDLIATGRTLFGAKPPKGQELEDHYFGSVKPRILEFMKEIEGELWQMGVHAKTRHNEVAPAQYELAPVFTTTNVSLDHNQLVMDTMKKIASKHGLVCLFHEKPFRGVNGSGKHNNWSMGSNDGQNLLEPGNNPHKNAQFLVFLAAIIQAVDKHGDLLRVSISNPGNDHRLGANEAPPAIISIFLGDQLTDIINQLESGEATTSIANSQMEIGVTTLPPLPKDTTDRNRTSPFAFTGNKFEFRAVPSSLSLGAPNFTLNTIVAESLDEIASILEKDIQSGTTLEKAVQKLLTGIIKKHKKIIFNGDNYSSQWKIEAEKRGLPNFKTLVDAMPSLIKKENIALFDKYKVLSPRETESRFHIILEHYNKTINQEGNSTLDIGRRLILPACIKYQGEIAKSIDDTKDFVSESTLKPQLDYLKVIAESTGNLKLKLDELEKILKVEEDDILKHAIHFREKVIPAMNEVREIADKLESNSDSQFWPLPTYSEMLFVF